MPKPARNTIRQDLATRAFNLAALAGSLFLLSNPAQADSPGSTLASLAPPSLPSTSLPEGIRITVGASAITAPLFEGSARYGVWAVPIIKFDALPGSSGGGGGLLDGFKSFDARSLDDISVGLFKRGALEIGPLLGYRIGRLEKDSPRLRGFGDIEGGFVAGGYARYDFAPFFVRASFHQRISGDDTGYLVRLATGFELPVTKRIVLKVDAYADYADDAYMGTYFGVSALQSARSGLAVFDAGAGFKSAGLTVGTEIALDKDWTLHATGGYTRLLGDAASSPIVETADRFEARLGLARSFDLTWK